MKTFGRNRGQARESVFAERAKRKFLMAHQLLRADGGARRGSGRRLSSAVLRESAQMKGEVDVFGNPGLSRGDEPYAQWSVA